MPVIAHTHVIKGFIEDEISGIRTLIVDDHEQSGFQDLDYDCWYMQVCDGHSSRVGDRINIRKTLVDSTPPSQPMNIRVR